MGLCGKMSNSLQMDANSAALADVIGCRRVNELKLGKDITFFIFLGGRLLF